MTEYYVDWTRVEVDERRANHHFQERLRFLKYTVPKIILEKKYKLFSNFSIADSYENLIDIEIDTGIYDPTDIERDRGPYYISHQDIYYPDNTPMCWIKMAYCHKLKPELKAKAYFLFNLRDVFDTIDLYLDMPYRRDPEDARNRDYPYPITKYMERLGIDINTSPYKNNDLVIKCDDILSSYYGRYKSYVEARAKLMKLRENTDGDEDELFRHAVVHEKRRKWYFDQTNALVDKIYSVSAAICGDLLGVPVNKLVEGTKPQKKE